MSKDANKLAAAADGFEAVGSLIGLLKPIVSLVMRNYHVAAKGFQRICEALLEANASLTGWINDFRDFDVNHPDSKARFAQLAKRYDQLKTGKGYQTLKFSCSDIGYVYNVEIRGKLQDRLDDRFKALFAGDKLTQAEKVFAELTQADGAMVEFIHNTVFNALDGVCTPMRAALARGDREAAQIAQAAFILRSEEFVKQLQAHGDALSDLVRQFSGLAASPPAAGVPRTTVPSS